MRFKDKVVLVTGASRGIGKATALAFAREGAKVIIDYVLDKDNATQVLAEIEKMGQSAIVIEADVSNENQVKSLMEKSLERFGRIDILVNNAGIAIDKPFSEKTVDEWKRTLEVNLIGQFICAKQAIPLMANNGGGVIVNMSSNNGTSCFSPDCIDYDSSKAGVIALTKNLAKESAKYGIRVNAVAPSWVETDMNADLPAEYVSEETKRIFLKRFAKPEEIANLVLFLASDEASYIDGTTVMIDGGYE